MIDLLIRILADGLVIVVVLISVWAFLFRLKDSSRLKAYSRILIAGLTAYLFAKLIATIYQPELERPFEQLGQAAGASYLNNPGFPSDHVLFVTALTLAAWSEVRSRWVWKLLLVLTALIAVGRVAALVHTPLDVIGGAGIAFIGGLWYLQKPSKTLDKQKEQKSVTISKTKM